LAGVGSQNLALSGEMPDGQQIVIKAPKTTLAFHIQEIPPSISLKPEYQLQRVNEKLASLVGHPMFDKMSIKYDDLYSKIIYIISKYGIPAFLFSNMSAESVETIPFVLHTPGLKRRLKEFAEWPYDPDNAVANMPSVNGEKYPVGLFITPNSRDPWISKSMEALEGLPEYNKELDASSLHKNPLIIWGAAALEGFFTDEEMPKVGTFLKAKYGSFARGSDTVKVLGQVHAMASLLAQYLDKCAVERMVCLCACCGLIFQVTNLEGEVVADGFKMLDIVGRK
jgi:hypothetical protein